MCEFVLAKYPRLPIEAAESVIKAFTDPLVMSDVGESLGIQFVMRWKVNVVVTNLLEYGIK